MKWGIKIITFLLTWGAITFFAPLFLSSLSFNGYEIVKVKKTIERGDVLYVYTEKNNEEFSFTLPYENFQKDQYQFHHGEKIVIQQIIDRDNQIQTYYISRYHLPELFSFILFFLLLVVFFAPLKILRSLFALVLSIGVLFGVLLPLLLSGKSIILYGVIASVLVAMLSVLITHGYSKNTIIGIVSITFTLVFSYFFSGFCAYIFSLYGVGSSDMSFVKNTYELVDLKGVFLIGIFWGTIGILDDVVMTQISSVQEIYNAKPSVSAKKLFSSGMKVGSTHIVSMINTLAFAYLASGISVFAYLYSLETPWWVIMSMDIFIEEFVRIFVGTISLVLAVPVSTFLISFFLEYEKNKKQSGKN